MYMHASLNINTQVCLIQMFRSPTAHRHLITVIIIEYLEFTWLGLSKPGPGLLVKACEGFSPDLPGPLGPWLGRLDGLG
jgi:hypothetical protein